MRNQNYETLFEISRRVNWQIDDLTGEGAEFDFSKPFLPETFARTERLSFLSDAQRLTLNHVRARGYLALFELVEQFVETFVADEARADSTDSFRAPALEQFVCEESKHRELFRRVLDRFDQEFGVPCGLIGPAENIKAAVLAHDRLAVLLLTLALEWMSQSHFVESVDENDALDPYFKRLLKFHWTEECQHARLDGLLLNEAAAARSAEAIDHAVGEYLELVSFFDAGFGQQAKLDLKSFELASCHRLPDAERAEFLKVQHQALRWTFLGSAMQNRNLLETLGALGERVPVRVRASAATYM